jgi:hypothetical protein
MVTHKFHFDQAKESFEALHQGDIVEVLFEM